MSILPDSVLIESKSARDNHLEQVSHESAQDTLNKVKALYFALWKGMGVATTEQMASFYVVDIDAVESALRRYRFGVGIGRAKNPQGQAVKGFQGCFRHEDGSI